MPNMMQDSQIQNRDFLLRNRILSLVCIKANRLKVVGELRMIMVWAAHPGYPLPSHVLPVLIRLGSIENDCAIAHQPCGQQMRWHNGQINKFHLLAFGVVGLRFHRDRHSVQWQLLTV